jgi:Ca2+-binding RTX toxin-like protein
MPVIDGTDDDDLLRGSDRADTITGGDGNDRILGLGGDDELNGEEGNDRIKGGAGNDEILGEAGNDGADGGDGNDRIDGDSGNDRMTGGAGADVFRFEYRDVDNSPYNIAGGGRDVVTDFVRGQDKLRITESSSRDSDTYQYSNGRTDWTSFDILKFSDLDTNEDGVLDATDEAIRIAEVELDNEAKDSLIIDLQRAGLFGSGAIDQIEPTSHRITLFGVTSLDASDFLVESGDASYL